MASRFIVTKLWREFVSAQPDASRIAPIAEALRASGYQIPVAVRALLMQPEVVSAEGADLLIKSPVELVIGLLRQSGGRLSQPAGAALAVAGMGQNLFSAPNVRGWPGGEAWINTQTLLARKQFIDSAVRPGTRPAMRPAAPAMGGMGSTTASGEILPPAGGIASADRAQQQQRAQAFAQRALEAAARVDGAAWLAQLGVSSERPLAAGEAARICDAVLLAPMASGTTADVLAYDALRAALLDPAYQLK